MHYSIICFKNQAMFALIKKRLLLRGYYGFHFECIEIEMKKVLKPLIHNDFKTSLLVIHRRFELRTP